MFASVHTATLAGLTAQPVIVQVDIARGLPSCTILGLPTPTLLTARDRIRAAFGNSSLDWPDQRITIALAPTDLPKHGAGFDLPLAIGLLAAAGSTAPTTLDGLWAVGELGLDGTLRPVRGVLAAALAARDNGARLLVVPTANLREAAAVPGLEVAGARSLRQVEGWLRGQATLDAAEPTPPPRWEPIADDLADVHGQPVARRALELAAAGGHHLLLLGPPGSGKTMLARRLRGILPALDQTEALEVAQIRSAAGLLHPDTPLVWQRPFQAPHYTVSLAGLIGGGGAIPRPGEVSLAHNGVLFLDDLPAFPRLALEALRQPLEDGWIIVTRATLTVRMPARFILVAAANWCPCGNTGDPAAGRACRCSAEERRRHLHKLFGPLTERIDLVTAASPAQAQTATPSPSAPAEPSAAVGQRVLAARARQAARGTLNARLPSRDLAARCEADAAAQRALTSVTERLGLTAWARDRTLRVARTIADLADTDRVSAAQVEEAVEVCRPDRSPSA